MYTCNVIDLENINGHYFSHLVIQAIALVCFFFSMLDGKDVLLRTTLFLSHKTWLAPSIDIPIILSQSQILMMSPITILSATNSAQVINVSTEFCLLEYHLIGVLLTNSRMPVTAESGFLVMSMIHIYMQLVIGTAIFTHWGTQAYQVAIHLSHLNIVLANYQ